MRRGTHSRDWRDWKRRSRGATHLTAHGAETRVAGRPGRAADHLTDDVVAWLLATSLLILVVGPFDELTFLKVAPARTRATRWGAVDSAPAVLG